MGEKDGIREQFNRDKLTAGIIRACEKRAGQHGGEIESLVAGLERLIAR